MAIEALILVNLECLQPWCKPTAVIDLSYSIVYIPFSLLGKPPKFILTYTSIKINHETDIMLCIYMSDEITTPDLTTMHAVLH